MGWHVQHVDWRGETIDGTTYREDVDALFDAFRAAKAETAKPSLIRLSTIMGWPSPTKQNTGAIHGALMGAEEVTGMKRAIGFDPDQTFAIDDAVLDHTRLAADRGRLLKARWDEAMAQWRAREPERAKLLDRLVRRDLPDGFVGALPDFPVGESLSTRRASGRVLNAIAPLMPELWGGAADLDESTYASVKGEAVFAPPAYATKAYRDVALYGRNIHYGVREHGMAAMASGIALHGLTRPYAASRSRR